MSGRKCQSTMITAEGTGTSGGVTSFDVLEVDELTVNSKLNLSKAAAKTTNFGEFQVEENRMQLDPESSYNAFVDLPALSECADPSSGSSSLRG